MDRRLKRHFDSDFYVVTVSERGWSGKRNGELLQAANGEFDALVTMDQGIPFQQNIRSYTVGVVVVSARSNRRQDVEPLMPAVNSVLRTIEPGQVLRVPA